MAGIFFSLPLELRYPTVLPRRGPNELFQSVYTSDLDLNGSRMTVMVPVPVGQEVTYPHSTRAQVMGLADVVGDTIFMRTGPSVFPGEDRGQHEPFISFRASATRWHRGGFDATISGGNPWPSLVHVCCSYEPDNDHLRNVKELAVSTHVLVTGTLLRNDCGVLEVKVHDVSREGEPLPCNAICLADWSMAPAKLRAICQWLETYYPTVECAQHQEGRVDTGSICDAIPSPGKNSQDGLHAGCQPAVSPGFTAEDDVAIRRLLDDAVAAGRRRLQLSSLARLADAAAALAATPAAPVAADENSGSPSLCTGAMADVSELAATPQSLPSAMMIPSTIPVADAVSTSPTPPYDAHRVPGRPANVVFAIRQALGRAFAFREEGPIGQTPVGWDGVHDVDMDSEPSSRESQSPSPLSAAVVLPLAVEMDARDVRDRLGHTDGDRAALPALERVNAAIARTEYSLARAHEIAHQITCKF